MGAILKSTSTFAISAMAILTVMGLLGLPLGPLLASAGVGGVALGFGAQSLVKDFLSGIFMIVEDQYGVGDVIDTGEAIGTVEDVTLRVTRLRDGNGVVWYIRNGEIVRIGNRSQGWSTAVVDTAVAYDEDIDRAISGDARGRAPDGPGPGLAGPAAGGAHRRRRGVDRRRRRDGADHRQVRPRRELPACSARSASGSRWPWTAAASAPRSWCRRTAGARPAREGPWSRDRAHLRDLARDR